MISSATLKGYGEVGPSADEALRDPFRPLGSDKAVNVVAENPGAPGSRRNRADEPASQPPASAATAPASPGPRSSSSRGRSSRRGIPRSVNGKSAGSRPRRGASTAASELLADIKKHLAGESKSMQGPQSMSRRPKMGSLSALPTGEFHHVRDRLGRTEPRVLHMMDAIAASLQNLQGAIVVRGHTDARPYRSATYDNWRLSSARAQMAYYMLTRGGLPEKRFERVEGYAYHHLRDSSHPLAAENRRIEILVRDAKP